MLKGHFKGAAAWKKKETSVGKEPKKEKANKLEEAEAGNEGSQTGSIIGRVVRVVRALGDWVKNKMSDIKMRVLDQGKQTEELSVSFLIDSGVYRTLLSAE